MLVSPSSVLRTALLYWQDFCSKVHLSHQRNVIPHHNNLHEKLFEWHLSLHALSQAVQLLGRYVIGHVLHVACFSSFLTIVRDVTNKPGVSLSGLMSAT